MENVKSFRFNNLARIHNDGQYISQRDLDNKEFSDYKIINFRDNNSAANLALSQPNIFMSGVYGVDGNEPNVIESDTYLNIQSLPI